MQQLLDTATAAELLGMIASGEISSRELFEAQLDRIDIFNPSVNAVVALDVERAMEAAAAADDERASDSSKSTDTARSLLGLPMTIKDCFETEGLVSTAGAPELADHIPTTDSDACQALRRAGAILYAKTNVPLYGGDHQTYNDVYGVTRNPWDPERTPGGSSGGAAVSVACGFSPTEVGSDIGGSIRVPAHYTGVFGLKPTHGVLSERGHIPGPPGSLAPTDLAVVGPLGRSVDDLRLLLDCLLTVHPFGGVPGAALPAATESVDVGSLRMGVWSDDPLAPVSGGVRSVIDTFARTLESQGVSVDSDARPSIDATQLHRTYLSLLAPIMFAGLPQPVFDSLAQQGRTGDDSTADVMARTGTGPHRDWMRADEARHHAIAAWDDLFERVDVVAMPACQTTAIPHNTDVPYSERLVDVDGVDREYGELLFWAGLATMPGLPVVTVPAGLIEDLPCGVALVGPRWSDRHLLDIAEAMCAATDTSFIPPTLVTG